MELVDRENFQTRPLVQLYTLPKSKSWTNYIQVLDLYLGMNKMAKGNIDHRELLNNTNNNKCVSLKFIILTRKKRREMAKNKQTNNESMQIKERQSLWLQSLKSFP